MEADKTKTLWSGQTPAAGLQYSEDCGECCVKTCCPCCITRKNWRVTGQGIFYRTVPPCSWFATGSFADLEMYSQFSYSGFQAHHVLWQWVSGPPSTLKVGSDPPSILTALQGISGPPSNLTVGSGPSHYSYSGFTPSQYAYNGFQAHCHGGGAWEILIFVYSRWLRLPVS